MRAHDYRVSAGRRNPIGTVLTIGVALVFTATLTLTANAPVSAHPTKTDLPTLRLISDGPLDNMEGGYGLNFLAVNAGLTRILPNDTVAPDLATWKISKNHLVYAFTIRSNARFSNGHSVTAQDAEFSLKRYLAPTNPSGGLTYLGLIRGAAAFNAGKTKNLSGVKVLDNQILQITITKPAAYFLGTLAVASTVFDPAVVAGKPLGSPSNQFKTNYLDTTCTGNQGAGPFEFVCHDHSSTLHSFYSGHRPKYTLVPNPYYYGHKPRIRVQLQGGRLDPSFNEYKAYLAGKLDVTGIPQTFLHQWKGRSKEYLEFPFGGTDYLVPNVHLAPFDDVHCRLAVANALDRNTLANNILRGTVHATYAVVPRGMLGYYSGKDNPHYNPAEARAELAQCPSRTSPFELKYNASVPALHNEYSAIGSMLSSVGMNVKLKPLSDNEWGTAVSQSLDKTDTRLIQVGWFQDYPDPQDYCTLLLRSGQQYNVGGWHDATYDRLVDRADTTLNRKERAKLYIRAQHIALSQGAMISLDYELRYRLIKPYVHGLVGSEAFNYLVPKDYDWANVSVSKH